MNIDFKIIFGQLTLLFQIFTPFLAKDGGSLKAESESESELESRLLERCRPGDPVSTSYRSSESEAEA